MRLTKVLAFSISLMLAAPVLAQPSGKAQVNTSSKAGPGQPLFMPAGGLVDGGESALRVANLAFDVN